LIANDFRRSEVLDVADLVAAAPLWRNHAEWQQGAGSRHLVGGGRGASEVDAKALILRLATARAALEIAATLLPHAVTFVFVLVRINAPAKLCINFATTHFAIDGTADAGGILAIAVLHHGTNRRKATRIDNAQVGHLHISVSIKTCHVLDPTSVDLDS